MNTVVLHAFQSHHMSTLQIVKHKADRTAVYLTVMLLFTPFFPDYLPRLPAQFTAYVL